MCIRDRPEILPEHLRVRVHIAGLKIYESVADIVTALKQVGQLVEIDRQRTEHSLFGVINRHIERLRTRLRDRRPVHSDRHDPIERGSRSPQLAAGDTLRSPGPYASDWARFAGWCDRRGLAALPATPATLGAYLTAAVTDPAGPAEVRLARSGGRPPGRRPCSSSASPVRSAGPSWPASTWPTSGPIPATGCTSWSGRPRTTPAGPARSRPSPTGPRWPPAGRAPGPGGGGSWPPPTPAGGSPSCAPCAPTTRPATSAAPPPSTPPATV